MPSQVVRPAPRPSDDDLFAQILAETDTTESPLPVDPPETDDEALADLFGAAATPPQRRHAAPRGATWPAHNFGPAYAALRRQRPARRGPRVLSESDLWEIEALEEPPADPPEPPAPVWGPWDAPRHGADDAWLDALVAPTPRATEARMLDLARGRPLHIDVLQAEETLHARPRLVRTRVSRRRAAPNRVLRAAGIGMALAAAVILLQLLLS